MTSLGVIILAAGAGTRMKGGVPKILSLLGHCPMISYIINTAQKLNPNQIVVVTSSDLVSHPIFDGITTTIQSIPKGTADAVRIGLEAMDPSISRVLILCGDTPLLDVNSVINFLDSDFNCTVSIGRILGFNVKQDHYNRPYGRMKVDDQEWVQGIIEWRDATESDRAISLCNSGVIVMDRGILASLIETLTPSPVSGEYYITDVICDSARLGYKIGYSIGMESEFQGINTLVELEEAHTVLQNKWRHKFLESGVHLIGAETIFLSYDTRIEPGATIYPYVTFGPNVTVSESSKIFSFSHLEDCTIFKHTQIGPFARLRGGTILEEGACVGNFVEAKNAHLSHNAKAKHLSYLGDVSIGENTNIGAGTITCNYDGKSKHKTEIGSKCSIGANSTLIAPLTIGNESIIAAGSVITDDIPQNSLTFGRSRQVNKSKPPHCE